MKPTWKINVCLWFSTLCLLGTSGALMALAQTTIDKCQNKDGKWIYTSRAPIDCHSTITTLSTQGIVLQQRDIFKKNTTKKLVSPDQAAQIAQDKKILRRYSAIEAIELERQRKLTELNKQLQNNQQMIDYLKQDIASILAMPHTESSYSTLIERVNVEKQYQTSHQKLKQEFAQINKRYDQINTAYLEAKARQIKNNIRR